MKIVLFFSIWFFVSANSVAQKTVYKSFSDTKFIKGDKILCPVILFADGRLDERAADSLKVVAGFLKAHPAFEVEIGYYTDSRGSDLYNKKLSIAKAQSIVDYLNTKYGIPVKQMVPYGYGETNPVYTEKQMAAVTNVKKQEEMHAENTRCELKILEVK